MEFWIFRIFRFSEIYAFSGITDFPIFMDFPDSTTDTYIYDVRKYPLPTYYLRRRLGAGMARVWRGYGAGMAQVWRRYGAGMAQVWRGYGAGMARVWRGYGAGWAQDTECNLCDQKSDYFF